VYRQLLALDAPWTFVGHDPLGARRVTAETGSRGDGDDPHGEADGADSRAEDDGRDVGGPGEVEETWAAAGDDPDEPPTDSWGPRASRARLARRRERAGQSAPALPDTSAAGTAVLAWTRPTVTGPLVVFDLVRMLGATGTVADASTLADAQALMASSTAQVLGVRLLVTGAPRRSLLMRPDGGLLTLPLPRLARAAAVGRLPGNAPAAGVHAKDAHAEEAHAEDGEVPTGPGPYRPAAGQGAEPPLAAGTPAVEALSASRVRRLSRADAREAALRSTSVVGARRPRS